MEFKSIILVKNTETNKQSAALQKAIYSGPTDVAPLRIVDLTSVFNKLMEDYSITNDVEITNVVESINNRNLWDTILDSSYNLKANYRDSVDA